MPSSSALPIVLCANESYIKYASVVMISLLERTQSQVRFYLLSDTPLAQATLAKLARIESAYPNASISHSVHSLARFASLPTQGESSSHITYLRLLLESILPKSVSRCVYLDCDVLVRADIARLFAYDLCGKLLGAVRDLAFNDASRVCANHFGLYFNAGVLLLDMARWRELKASEQLFSLIASHPQITQGFHDQNLLNECFAAEVRELPLGWNVIYAPPHILRFTDRDCACSDKSAIASRALRLHTPSMRPCTRLQNTDFSSTIPESQSGVNQTGTTTKVANLPQSLQSNHSPTAIPRILEEKQSSSRADTIGVAIHNSAPAESNAINSAHKVRNLESVVGGLGGVRGDKGGDFAIQAPLSPLEKDLSQVELESSQNAQKVDSSTNALSLSSRADEVGVAIHNTNADSMDCHEVVPTSRNDNNTQNLNEPAKDSKSCGEKTSEAVQGEAQAGFFSKSGLCKHSQGRALGVRNRPECEAIKALSRKAESTQKAKSRQAQNASPKLLCRHSQASYTAALESPYIVHFAAIPKPWGRVCYIKQTESSLELIEYHNPYAKQWWKIARKSPFFTEIARSFIAPTLQAYKTKAIFFAKGKAPRIYTAMRALARCFAPSQHKSSHKGS